uniref:Uncharacterized protein n=1 Tax=Rhizophora mucronata TaxID=61149 RepID=A0A2P2PVQ0_RHIMU
MQQLIIWMPTIKPMPHYLLVEHITDPNQKKKSLKRKV